MDSPALLSVHAWSPSRSRGHTDTLPSGSFRARVMRDRSPDRQAPVPAGDSYQLDAAEIALTKLQRQVDEARHPKTAFSVRQTITQWLEMVELEDTTRDRYDDLIRLYILPPLGNMLASKLDAELLERFYARLHRCRSLCTGDLAQATSASR